MLKAAGLQHVVTWCIPRLAGAARNAVAAVAPHLGQARQAAAGTAPRQLLVDVSIIASHDARTGIQRVVRSLLLELLRAPPHGFVIRPVAATRNTPYRYADEYLATLTGSAATASGNGIVKVEPNDIFLGLDLTSRIAPRRQQEFLRWRSHGVRFAFIVYDLLPALHPHWFTPRARKSYRHWMAMLTMHADALFCISRSVADDLSRWLWQRHRISARELTPSWFHLGAELPVLDAAQPAIRTSLRSRLPERVAVYCGGSGPAVLMVGTIEPRKGHAQILDAFERLWARGRDIRLVMVGQEGWNVAPLAERLRSHMEASKRLIWLNAVADDELAALYANLDGLVMASEAEGFGLPLIEAAHYRMPIFARDLAVFREVAGEHATYFRGKHADALADEVDQWLRLLQSGEAPDSGRLLRLTWASSADQLKRLIERLAT